MTMFDNIEKLFQIFDSSVLIYKKDTNLTYFEGVLEIGYYFFDDTFELNVSVDAKNKIDNILGKMNIDEYSSEETRKAFQLVFLKAMRQNVQSHHQMTADSVALFISYLVSKLTTGKQDLTLIDPAIGTGNLLTAVVNQNPNKFQNIFGIEIDDSLIKIALINANMQKHSIELIHQDTLEKIFVPQGDILICDIPVGYYTRNELAKSYFMSNEEEMSYIHELFIERSINLVNEDGYLVLLIPNILFESPNSKKLHSFISDNAYILGLVHLPESLFKNQSQQKSIFILQKKGSKAIKPNHTMLVELPSFNNVQAFEKVVAQINNWFEKELKIIV
ncbi:MAG: methylase [Bacillales bacterium]|jgi:site-specific DNA-methyltransferase (adenine-specific)|nr:methylase [Bacillales bacterium]